MPPATDWERLWEDLLGFLEEGTVIPVVGQELLTVEIDGKTAPFYTHVAERLADRLQVPWASENEPLTLDAVARGHRKNNGDLEDIYPAIQRIVAKLGDVPIPPALQRLAEITPFRLFVATTFDPLLRRALDRVRGAVEGEAQVLAYSPSRQPDLPCTARELRQPVVYHLLGSVSSAPDYAVTEEDLLEFLHALQSETRRPPLLFDELTTSHLLILGSGLSDWLTRFLVRITRKERLRTDRKMDVLAGPLAARDSGLVVFLEHFANRMRVYPGSAEEFVKELHARWTASHPAAGAALLPPAAVNVGMEQGAVFLSYASEERAVVDGIREDLERARVAVWFDKRSLEPGNNWSREIESGIHRASVFVPILSRLVNAPGGREFRKEWEYALEEAKGRSRRREFVVPVLLDDAPETEAEAKVYFQSQHWVRFPADREALVQKVLALFRSYHMDPKAAP